VALKDPEIGGSFEVKSELDRKKVDEEEEHVDSNGNYFGYNNRYHHQDIVDDGEVDDDDDFEYGSLKRDIDECLRKFKSQIMSVKLEQSIN